jgi:coproporphyrinogen III oxidase
MSDGRWWYGGGIDLTPHYVNKEDTIFFHNYFYYKNTNLNLGVFYFLYLVW